MYAKILQNQKLKTKAKKESDVLPLDMSILHQPLLSLDVSLRQQPVRSLEVSVLQQPLLPFDVSVLQLFSDTSGGDSFRDSTDYCEGTRTG